MASVNFPQQIANFHKWEKLSNEQYAAIGKWLYEEKKLCGHGNWIEFMKENLPFSQQQANNYMRYFRAYGDKPEISLTEFLKL